MTNRSAAAIQADLDLLHTLSDIYSNLRGRKRPTEQHKQTLDNLELNIHQLTNQILKDLNHG